MKFAAGLIGILMGIFSIGYVGIYGGIVGSAAGWLSSWGPANNSLSDWADMVKLLSWVAPLLSIGGGAIAFGSPRFGSAPSAIFSSCPSGSRRRSRSSRDSQSRERCRPLRARRRPWVPAWQEPR